MKEPNSIDTLLLREMVEEDREFILAESTELDDIIPDNNTSLFDDVVSDEELDAMIDDLDDNF